MRNNYDIAGAIVVIGLAAVSVVAWVNSNGEIGSGWALLSVLSLFGWNWNYKKTNA